MMSLLPDEVGLYLFLIHFYPSDVFCLPSQIPSALLEVRSLCIVKNHCIAGNQVPSAYEKDLEVPRKHKNAYPHHRPTF